MTSKRAIYRLEALKNWFKEDSEQYLAIGKAIEALQRVESVGEKTDCVEVVRCKDCKHFHYDFPVVVDGILILGDLVCDFWGDGGRTNEDAFCSYGERKEE